MKRVIDKFLKTGSVRCKSDDDNNLERGPAAVRDPEKVEAVIGLVSARPTISSREIEENSGVPRTTAQRILRHYRYKSYKIQCHQELFPWDLESRSEFCENVMERANDDRNFLLNICFSDESSFTLHNEPNRQDTRYWAQQNPHNVVATRTQYPQKVNVWAGIFRHHIIGPFFIEGNLDCETYHNLLTQSVIPRLREIEPNLENSVWFQQDGCPAHRTLAVTNVLRATFSGTLSNGGTVHWPPRSPDLAPCDFFLWGHLKSKIYRTRHRNLQGLREVITQTCQQITHRQLANVRREFYDRLGFCLAQNGDLFEHLI